MMKRVLIALLAALLCALLATGLGESATLSYEESDDGGYTYVVEIDDPSVLVCEESRDSGATFTFTGLMPGSAQVAVYGRSPEMDNDDYLYAAVVDEALNVTLTSVRAISSLYLIRYGELYSGGCRVTRERDGYRLSLDDERTVPLSDGQARALMDVVETYDLVSWDGFDDYLPDVLDGEIFRLEIRLTDGTSIVAQGDNVFPKDYRPATDAMQEIFEAALSGED